MKIPLIPSSEITPKQVYLSRRDFIKAAGVIAGSVALVACTVPPGKIHSFGNQYRYTSPLHRGYSPIPSMKLPTTTIIMSSPLTNKVWLH